MINGIKTYLYIGITLFVFMSFTLSTRAEVVTVNAMKLLPKVEVSLSPRSGSFVEGSTFEVPIIINTKNSSINGIEVVVIFDKNKLSVIKPSGGTSIIGIWVEPPKYDNERGMARYVGVIPDGITTKSGLIGTITFKALKTGNATVSIRSDSKILLNDGMGTEASADLGRANYEIITKAPDGVRIFSDTHPVQDDWYNNNSPVLSWDRDTDVDGFSYVLDNKFSTIPESTINTNDTSKGFTNLADGLWYFHVKAHKGGAKGEWGTTGHFLIRIDTAPPAEFKPEANYLLAATILAQRTLVSFFTTDNLSGVDHYEVGIIDKSQPLTVSPVFIQTESPFQVPVTDTSNLQVIVRAVDKAGNMRDESIEVRSSFSLLRFIKDYIIYIILILSFISYITISHFRNRLRIMKKIKENEVNSLESR